MNNRWSLHRNRLLPPVDQFQKVENQAGLLGNAMIRPGDKLVVNEIAEFAGLIRASEKTENENLTHYVQRKEKNG